MCREGFKGTLGEILPHVTNGQYDLAALIQSRADVPLDGAVRARKSVTQMQMLISECGYGMKSSSDMDLASALIQVLDEVFTATSGGLVMSANLVTKNYPLAVHAGIIEAGAKTVLGAAKRLKQHVAQIAHDI
jgi:hypothetical protein